MFYSKGQFMEKLCIDLNNSQKKHVLDKKENNNLRYYYEILMFLPIIF